MSSEIDNALDDCLDRLALGESIGACLRRYPEYTDELEPLLRAAEATMRAGQAIRPSPASRAHNFDIFMQAVAQRAPEADRAVAPRRRRLRFWMPSFRGLSLAAPIAKPILAAVVLLAILTTGFGVTTAAASNSVPGEPLYWVKTTRENIEQRLPRSDTGRASYEANLAHTRGDEVQILIQRGRFTMVGQTMQRMSHHLDRSSRYAGVMVIPKPTLSTPRPAARIGENNARQIADKLRKDRDAFREKSKAMIEQLSYQDRERAQELIWKAELGYWLLIDAMENSRSTR